MIYKHVPIHRVSRTEMLCRFAVSAAGSAAGVMAVLLIAAALA